MFLLAFPVEEKRRGKKDPPGVSLFCSFVITIVMPADAVKKLLAAGCGYGIEYNGLFCDICTVMEEKFSGIGGVAVFSACQMYQGALSQECFVFQKKSHIFLKEVWCAPSFLRTLLRFIFAFFFRI